MKNILVAIDGSRFSDMAMDKAKELADIYGTQLLSFMLMILVSTY